MAGAKLTRRLGAATSEREVDKLVARAENVVHSNAAVRAYGRVGAWERALALYGRLRYAGAADARSDSAVLLAVGDDWMRVRALQERMELRTVSGNIAIHAAARAGEWEQALQLVARLDRGGFADERTYAGCFSALPWEQGGGSRAVGRRARRARMG